MHNRQNINKVMTQTLFKNRMSVLVDGQKLEIFNLCFYNAFFNGMLCLYNTDLNVKNKIIDSQLPFFLKFKEIIAFSNDEQRNNAYVNFIKIKFPKQFELNNTFINMYTDDMLVPGEILFKDFKTSTIDSQQCIQCVKKHSVKNNNCILISTRQSDLSNIFSLIETRIKLRVALATCQTRNQLTKDNLKSEWIFISPTNVNEKSINLCDIAQVFRNNYTSSDYQLGFVISRISVGNSTKGHFTCFCLTLDKKIYFLDDLNENPKLIDNTENLIKVNPSLLVYLLKN